MFAGNFAPNGWALCDGQLLAVAQNDALFSLLGTIYGGDGRTTFGLPDLRGRLPVHTGWGPGLTSRPMGQTLGEENNLLSISNIPTHSHQALVSTAVGSKSDPDGAFLASSPGVRVFRPAPVNATFEPDTISTIYGGLPLHTNLMPFLCVHFIIALVGIYPTRS